MTTKKGVLNVLVGTIVVKQNEFWANSLPFTGSQLAFNFNGVDSSSMLYGVLTSSLYDAIQFMAGTTDDRAELWERRFDLGLCTVKVEQVIDKDSAGKAVKRGANYDFFCSLGALIRYAKRRCRPEFAEGYTGLASASGEFVAEETTTYVIPFEDNSGILGRVQLKLGEIIAMQIETPLYRIDIHEDAGEPIGVFRPIKQIAPKGFEFSAEYLKIPIVPATPPTTPYAVVNNDGMYHSLEEIIAHNPDKDFLWLKDKQYFIVSDDMLDEVCEMFKSYPKDTLMYFDTETTGLNINFKSRLGQADQCVGVILSVEDGVSYYFPMQMKAIPNLCGGDHFYFMQAYMKEILETYPLAAHNMSFDWKVAYIYDINANIVHDSMALINLTLGQEKEQFPAGLKDLTRLLLHRDALELSDLIVADEWGENEIKFWDLPYELVRLYGCADTDNLRGLIKYAEQHDLLHRYNATKVYEIEIAFSLAVAYQEFYGHKINTEKLATLHEEIDAGIKESYDKMVELVGAEFNPNSSKQLIDIMYHQLGIPEQISRKTGRPTTDKDTLKALAEVTDLQGNHKYPFAAYMQEFRTNEGVRKIIDQFPELATPDGYIFSEVQQYGTRTGRVSIKKPNYQSYNNAVKKHIVPRPGFYMTDTDYSSVEYRVLGNMAGNEMIKQGFVDPDFDYHAYQAARMYGVSYASVGKELRKAAKGINFGLPYGMGDESLGMRVFGEATKENTRRAAALRAKYFEGQEDIKDFFENTRANGVANGYTETFFGRRRYYHRNKYSVPAIRRQAGNAVIQGCLDGDTRIQTKELGIVKLKDVAGYSMHVWDGEKWSNGDVMYSGKKQKCVVHFSNGQSITCSPIHKFYVVSAKGNGRFVECKDLRGKISSSNPHRVVINKHYEASDYVYSSAWARQKFVGTSHNAKNVYLDDTPESFDIGVFLGRLASDGSYKVRTDGGSYLQHFIAEHEEDILPELRFCMENYGFTEKLNDVREGRNERITHLSVHSDSLVKEIEGLDIKHQVSDDIFMDTELLRGFLRGFFDGDGGISGKRIALTFGTQYDFEPMCKDLQKALLFYGIRSRYHKYDDRHVLSIKTNDNARFLELVGFVNPIKQAKGEELECIKDEHIFGPCLVVDHVDITDEYIDMYDVCNTDGGYFVADGVVTHNTAADIYKLAVGRVFLRICKEGWLGKVLLTGFIHDELLCEVHESIDPMVWLRVLREEFEVKIEGWCPLYMGFGFGMSWYEAKSVELPIQLQWELVDKYGIAGYPKWHYDGYALCAEIPEMLRDFTVRHIGNCLTLPEAQGKEIQAAVNKAMFDLLKDDIKVYNKYFADKQADTLNIEECVKDLSAEYISSVIRDENGNVVLELAQPKETQVAIDLYCALHGVDRATINVLDIADSGVDAEAPSLSDGSMIDYSDYDDFTDEEGRSAEDIKRENMDKRVEMFGLYLDIENSMVVLKMLPQNYMAFIKQHSNNDGKGYRIRFKDSESKMFYDTQCYLESEKIQTIQSMYIQYFNTVASAK